MALTDMSKVNWRDVRNESANFPHLDIPSLPPGTQTVESNPPEEPVTPRGLTAVQTRALVDQRIREKLNEALDRAMPPFRVEAPSVRPIINRNSLANPEALAAQHEQVKQQLTDTPTAELNRIAAVYEHLLNGTPIPHELGVPIISFDGNVSFADPTSSEIAKQ
jgi:hypothetical protein